MSLDLTRDSPADWISEQTTADEVRQIVEFLTKQGTFRFPALSNGLFSASAGGHADIEVTGYQSIWLRDNIHIAWAHWVVLNDATVARRCVQTLMDFYSGHRHRLTAVIQGKSDFNDPMNRPHIRFNGVDLSELPEKWSHAQNDALGYFLWLVCRLLLHRQLSFRSVNWGIIADLVHYWTIVKFWQDEDSGHWEEARKVSASSIGTATAGLTLLCQLMDQPEAATRLAAEDHPVHVADVQSLIDHGREALTAILPAECIQHDESKQRNYDAALLFLIYPLRIVDRPMAEQILSRVRSQLMGPYGIRRYPGDSYWCADYKQMLDASTRTVDFSDNMEARDALLKPGMEAQWCIFDPIISCIHGEWFLQEYAAVDRSLQVEHLRRSLSQMTGAESPFGAFRCPESWYFENNRWTPNDITPLLWTQANLWQALKILEVTLT